MRSHTYACSLANLQGVEEHLQTVSSFPGDKSKHDHDKEKGVDTDDTHCDKHTDSESDVKVSVLSTVDSMEPISKYEDCTMFIKESNPSLSRKTVTHKVRMTSKPKLKHTIRAQVYESTTPGAKTLLAAPALVQIKQPKDESDDHAYNKPSQKRPTFKQLTKNEIYSSRLFDDPKYETSSSRDLN